MTIRDLLDSGKITMETVVLGELLTTADGCVVGDGAEFWICRSPDHAAVRHGPARFLFQTDMANIGHKTYSTRLAAEQAAKEEQSNG